MRRKLISMAGKTLVISIPAKIVKKYSLVKGDELELREGKNSVEILFVEEPSRPKKVEKKLYANKLGKSLGRTLGACYKSGVDHVFIHNYTEGDKDSITNTVSKLIGYEIVSGDKGVIVVSSISSLQDEEFQTVFRKLFQYLLSNCIDLHGLIQTNDFKKINEFKSRDIQVNKYADFCRRLLNKRRDSERGTIASYLIVEQLEKLGDIYRDFSVYVNKNSITVRKPINEIYLGVLQYFRNFYEAFISYTPEKTHKLIEDHCLLRKKIISLLDLTTGEEVLLLFYLLESLELLFGLNGALISLNL